MTNEHSITRKLLAPAFVVLLASAGITACSEEETTSEKIQNSASEMADDATDAMDDAKDATVDAWNDAKDATEDAATDAGNAIEDGCETVKQEAGASDTDC